MLLYIFTPMNASTVISDRFKKVLLVSVAFTLRWKNNLFVSVPPFSPMIVLFVMFIMQFVQNLTLWYPLSFLKMIVVFSMRIVELVNWVRLLLLMKVRFLLMIRLLFETKSVILIR